MGDIYQNAVLTIAASSSKSCDISFLSPKSMVGPPTLSLVFTDQNRKSYDLKALRLLSYHEHDEFEAGPLHQRAWCYQEYLLSTRVISYNNSEITFKCRSGSTCQCQQRLYDTPYTSRVLFEAEIFHESELLECWFDIIHNYSERELTFSTDRLAALSGIASSIQKATGWTYVAGIWSERVLTCLCWRSITPFSTTSSVTNIDIAPTFSWASVHGPVFHDDPVTTRSPGEITIHTILIRLHFNVVGRNPFDRVASGAFIELEGPVLEVCMVFDESTSSYYAQYDDCEWSFFPDSPLGVVTLGEKVVAARCKETGSGNQLDGVSISILFLATSPYNGSHTDAIVLRKLQTNSDCFERIGLLHYGVEAFRGGVRERQEHKVSLAWVQEARRSRVRIY